MKKKVNYKIYLIPLIIIGVIAGYFVVKSLNHSDYTGGLDLAEIYIPPKIKKGINEYTPINISDNAMCGTYFSKYLGLMINDKDEAYKLINEDYRNKKFGSLNNFDVYINTVTNNYSIYPTIRSCSVTNKDNYDLYKVTDLYGNGYIFKVSAVMMYEVYFDDYTVNIN